LLTSTGLAGRDQLVHRLACSVNCDNIDSHN
jgi:hypothetical protein